MKNVWKRSSTKRACISTENEQAFGVLESKMPCGLAGASD